MDLLNAVLSLMLTNEYIFDILTDVEDDSNCTLEIKADNEQTKIKIKINDAEYSFKDKSKNLAKFDFNFENLDMDDIEEIDKDYQGII